MSSPDSNTTIDYDFATAQAIDESYRTDNEKEGDEAVDPALLSCKSHAKHISLDKR